MKHIVYINCCIRDKDSRTLKIATPIIDSLKNREDVKVSEINLFELDLVPYNKKEYLKKASGYIDPLYIEYSKMIAGSDGLIIAAPFWDMSFPAQLKTFLEGVSLFEIMFASDNEKCNGLAKCPFMALITTRGMNIPVGHHLEQGTPYLKALSWLWGIKDFYCIDTYNFDYISQEKIEEKIKEASKQGIELLNKII